MPKIDIELHNNPNGADRMTREFDRVPVAGDFIDDLGGDIDEPFRPVMYRVVSVRLRSREGGANAAAAIRIKAVEDDADWS